MHSNDEWKRFSSLFIALTVAMFIAVAGKVLLLPSQTWLITIDAGLSKSAAKHTIIMWGWFALGMMLPLAIRSLSRPGNSSQKSLSGG